MSSLTKRELQDVAILHLLGPDGALLYVDGDDGKPDLTRPQRIHLYGPGTKQYAGAMAEVEYNAVERYQRKGKGAQSADEKITERARFCAAMTHSFENIESDHGATGEALFLEVYLNPKLGMYTEQAERFARGAANFTTGSSPP